MDNSSVYDTGNHSGWADLCRVMNAYIASTTLYTACELDLFSKLHDTPGLSHEEISGVLGLAEYGVRVLLLNCCVSGLLIKEQGRYYNSPISQKYLNSRSDNNMIPFIRYNHLIQKPGCETLLQALRESNDTRRSTIYQNLSENPVHEKLFQDGMSAYTKSLPFPMDDVPGMDRITRLVDIGGGNGYIAIETCRRYPNMKVTILEIDSVSRRAQESIAKHGLQDRIRSKNCDVFKEPWPSCDAVLMSHFVEIFDPDKIRFLYKKAYDILPSGGILIIWTLTSNDSRTGGFQAAKSSVYFFTTANGGGVAYTTEEHLQCLKDTCFDILDWNRLEEIDHSRIIAKKP